jgi:hypothetical protein
MQSIMQKTVEMYQDKNAKHAERIHTASTQFTAVGLEVCLSPPRSLIITLQKKISSTIVL